MTQNRLLGNRYQLGDLLGYGGMAEVHHGRDQRLGRDVAIKVLRADLARDANFQTRFRREAQNAAALNHPAIVAVYDTGEENATDGSLPYIVMEYVEGRTLKDVLLEEGPLMPQRALELVADVCAALEFSHKHNIIHRDIKPANVMLTRAGSVKVMDFGIARAISSATATMTQTSAVIGTAQYLSPEQARGESVDARSDVYSTGCLLYELLVGEPPFTGDNPVAVAYQHVREDPIPPSERNSGITAVMDAVVLKAMAKNPANRYQSAAQMRTDLLRAAAGRAVGAPAVLPAAERTAVLPRRSEPVAAAPIEDEHRSKKAVTWALVALGLIAIFVVAAFLTREVLNTDQQKVSVPNVKNKTLPDAIRILESKKFKYVKKDVVSSLQDKGIVTNQTPDPNQEASLGSKVQLEVGQGPDLVHVPNLDGQLRIAAEELLKQANLKANFTEVNSSEQQDKVISPTEPPKDASVPKDSTVEVKISKGNLKKMPDLVGRTVESAKGQLQQQGFTAEPTITEVASDKTPDTVVDQTPKANSDQQPGTAITLNVPKKPETSDSTDLPTGRNPSQPPTIGIPNESRNN